MNTIISYVPRRYRGADLAQIAIEFPPSHARDYRWLFADGTRSAWRPVPARSVLHAPPGARGLEWREPTGLKNRELYT